jgi:hypothetical protein
MDFAKAQTNALERLKVCTDLALLKKELTITKRLVPDCAAESLYRTNKLSIIEHRIKELEDDIVPYFSLGVKK